MTANPMSPSEPTSLQESFALLYRSSHLGVVIAGEIKGVVDANDAFLQMIGYTREEMLAGKVDWWAMTPEECRPLDINAIQQVREYGVCVPYEKAYILRDGSRLPFMLGAVRLSVQPLTWAAYTVDLREHYETAAAEQHSRDLRARASLLNQLAHDLNNPLAALTFMLHLLSRRPDIVTDESRRILADATEQLERIARTVREVLTISRNP